MQHRATETATRFHQVVDLTSDDRPAVMANEIRVESQTITDMPFSEIELPDEIRAALNDLGFSHCTPIQREALPEALKGRDVAGQAQTGTGKTAAFLITIIKQLLEVPRSRDGIPRAVVVAPTRELALQIADDAVALTRHTDLTTVAVFGGMDWEKQARELEGEVDIVVGTPGRMMDYMKRGILDLRAVEVVVIDEADRMFDMGFVQDIRFILSKCTRDRQTLLFSATFTYDVLKLAKRYMKSPYEVKIEPGRITAASVEQRLYHVSSRKKLQFLLWLLEEEQPKKALVFVNTKRTGDYLNFKLFENGWESEYISGDVSQKKRLKLIDQFKDGKLELLVATDVAARGLHVEDVDLVINYDLPLDAEDYVHRIGRTGRAGAEGKAIALACEKYAENLPSIERYIKARLEGEVAGPGMYLSDEAPSYKSVAKPRGRGGPGGRSGGGRGPKRGGGRGPRSSGGPRAASGGGGGSGGEGKRKRRRGGRGRKGSGGGESAKGGSSD
jgi:ATP-dependent RNA helicase RhlB